MAKRCAQCQESKPPGKFFPSLATTDGLKPICSACYFARNGGRSPKGFVYVTPPSAIKVWLTSLWQNQEIQVTLAEGIPTPQNPNVMVLLPARWEEEGGIYHKPDWHSDETSALQETQRLVDELVEARRREYAEACALRALVRDGKKIRLNFR